MPAAWSVRARGTRRRRVKQVVLAIDKFVASSSAAAAAEEDAHTARLVLDVYVCILVYMQSSAS